MQNFIAPLRILLKEHGIDFMVAVVRKDDKFILLPLANDGDNCNRAENLKELLDELMGDNQYAVDEILMEGGWDAQL